MLLLFSLFRTPSHCLPFCFPSFPNHFLFYFSFILFLPCCSFILFPGIFCYNDLHSRMSLRVSWRIVKHSASRHGVTFQKKSVFIRTAVRASYLPWFVFTGNNKKVRIQVFWNVRYCHWVQTWPLKLKTARSFEMSGSTNPAKQRHVLCNTAMRNSNLRMQR
jgi:hypothetical protein